MARIDVYLRSIEKFTARGAVLASGQNVILRFPDGDRSASQTIAHDALVMLVREIAPPAAFDLIDKNRPAKFEHDSNGTRYTLTVAPKPGAWQVEIAGPGAAIEPATVRVPSSSRAPTPSPIGPAPAVSAAPDGELLLERGQYDVAPSLEPVITTGSAMLDGLLAAARASRATDLYLSAGAPPFMRVAQQLTGVPGDRALLDGDQLSRELGVAAPAEARAHWAERGVAVFAYGDAGGRVRVTLTRDQRGPGAALRLLVAEPPPLDHLALGAEVDDWLEQRGLIAIAGPSASGKTTTLAALVRALGERNRRVIAIEEPVEILQSTATPWVSQRAVGEHVPSFTAGVAAAMYEGADAIVIGAVASPDAAAAVVDAIAGGHLVLTTVPASSATVALDRILERLPGDHRHHARTILAHALLGTIGTVGTPDGRVAFEVVVGAPT